MTEPEHPDYARCQAARNKEPDGVQWLTERLQLVPRTVQRLANRLGSRSPEDLSDMSQEAALTALRRLDSYHGRAAFDAWLHEICLRTVLGHVRRSRLRAMPNLEHEPETAEPQPLERLGQSERSRQLRDAVDQMGGVEAEVVKERDLKGRDFADISASTGIAIATLRTRYYRGLKKLQVRLRPTGAAQAWTTADAKKRERHA